MEPHRPTRVDDETEEIVMWHRPNPDRRSNRPRPAAEINLGVGRRPKAGSRRPDPSLLLPPRYL